MLVLSIGSGTPILAGAEEIDAGQTKTDNPIQTEPPTEIGNVPEPTETPTPTKETETLQEVDQTAVPIEETAPLSFADEKQKSTDETDTDFTDDTKLLPKEEKSLMSASVNESVGQQNDSINLQREATENDVASVTINETTTYYQDIVSAFQAADGNTATLELLKDTSYSAELSISSGSIVLKGNNHTLTWQEGKRIIVYGGSLTVQDVTFLFSVMSLQVRGGNLIVSSGTINTLDCDDGTITIQGGTINSLACDRNGTTTIQDGTINDLHCYGGTTTIHGGTIDNLHCYGGTTTIQGGTIDRIHETNGLTYDLTATVSVQAVSAGSITVEPLTQTETFGQAEYSLNKEDWQTSNILNCNSGTTYTVYARYERYSDKVFQTNATSKSASYLISIPATTLKAGTDTSKATIAVDPSQTFDLGYNGQVAVKITRDGNVSNDGKLTLTRMGASDTITSALLVNDTALGSIDGNVATFTMDNQTSVSVSFAKPTETNIPAGTYSGTMTFEVSYSEPTT